MEKFIDSFYDLFVKYFQELVYNLRKKSKIFKLFIKNKFKGKISSFSRIQQKNNFFFNFVPSYLRSLTVFILNGTSTTNNASLIRLLRLAGSIVEELENRIPENIRNWTSFLQDVDRFVSMGGTYLTLNGFTTFDGGSNPELQRMASQLFNELPRLVNLTNRSAFLLGYLRDIEAAIYERDSSFVGRHSSFTLGSIYSLSDTRFFDNGSLNRYYNYYTSPLRLSSDNNGHLVPYTRNARGPSITYLYNLEDLFNAWERIYR